MEVPMLGIELELQLQAYAIATPDPSHIYDLLCSSKRQIFNPLSKARHRIHIFMDITHVLNVLNTFFFLQISF